MGTGILSTVKKIVKKFTLLIGLGFMNLPGMLDLFGYSLTVQDEAALWIVGVALTAVGFVIDDTLEGSLRNTLKDFKEFYLFEWSNFRRWCSIRSLRWRTRGYMAYRRLRNWIGPKGSYTWYVRKYGEDVARRVMPTPDGDASQAWSTHVKDSTDPVPVYRNGEEIEPLKVRKSKRNGCVLEGYWKPPRHRWEWQHEELSVEYIDISMVSNPTIPEAVVQVQSGGSGGIVVGEASVSVRGIRRDAKT